MTTLYSRNGNCVAALQPAPGDLFVVTLIAGRVAVLRSSNEYEQVLRLAEAFADGTQATSGRPITIKVLGATLAEVLLMLKIDRQDLAAGLKIDDVELRTLIVGTSREILRDSQDAAARLDAYGSFGWHGSLGGMTDSGSLREYIADLCQSACRCMFSHDG